MLSQAELETEGSGLATIFGLPPTPPRNGPRIYEGNDVNFFLFFLSFNYMFGRRLGAVRV